MREWIPRKGEIVRLSHKRWSRVAIPDKPLRVVRGPYLASMACGPSYGERHVVDVQLAHPAGEASVYIFPRYYVAAFAPMGCATQEEEA